MTNFLISGFFASAMLYLPTLGIYHLLTRNGRGHVALRHRYAVGRTSRPPVIVNPIPYRLMLTCCAVAGFGMVALYLT